MSSRQNTEKDNINIPKADLTEDDSDDGNPYISPFILEDSVKSKFTDEFDLFKYFFSYLKKTRHLVTIIEQIRESCNKPALKLYECKTAHYTSDPKFVPMQFDIGNDFNTSDKIDIKFNKLNKRIVKAKSTINVGEILSIEKAFILTNKPNTEEEKFSVYRCHHCLRIISCFVTCTYCDVVIFCSYLCRNTSWYEGHVWECYGLQKKFWDVSSLQYLAMRMLFLGARHEFDTGDEEFNASYTKEPNMYVNMTTGLVNSYKYLHNFTYDLDNKSKLELGEILMKCANILVYLVECTYFFSWLSKLSQFEKMKPYDMYLHIGGRLLRHYCQAQIHVVLIDQFPMISIPFLQKTDFISSGIFLCESIYDNSCKGNAVFCIRDNYVIIKAAENIEVGETITVKWYPQNNSCSCQHCLKYCQLNAFICINCKGAVMSENDEDQFKYRDFHYENVFKHIIDASSPLTCSNCKLKLDINMYQNLDNIGQNLISRFKQYRNIHDLERAIRDYRHVFQPTHIFHSYLYIMALEYYITNRQIRNPAEAADILKKYFVIAELHSGKYSKSLLCGRCGMLLEILDIYSEKTCPPAIVKVCRKLLQSIKILADFHCISYKVHVLEKVIKTNYESINLLPI